MSRVTTSGLNCSNALQGDLAVGGDAHHFDGGMLAQRLGDQAADDHRIVHDQYANPLARW